MVADQENSRLAAQLIDVTYAKQGLGPGQLILHADRGTQMTSKITSQLLLDLGIIQSHSRPRVSNDNAFSEAQFKTLKCRPTAPKFFESLEEARRWSREMMAWYNHEHHHESLGWMKQCEVHHGLDKVLAKERQQTLEGALSRHPERFVRGQVKAPAPPDTVFLNKLPALQKLH